MLLSLWGSGKYSGLGPLVEHGSLGILETELCATFQIERKQWESHGGCSTTIDSYLRRGYLPSKKYSSGIVWRQIGLGQAEIGKSEVVVC